ncbi:Protein of unknown function [Paenibacillus sp. UNC496MF]|uniref:acyclic terpene utilization AtuA family protein n=1 Tax=Paenibacillus sp. UNC496MF TaxID=1502753 RepID=UPI0008E07B08|nr:acyclic terpene utilization AtuA family protein [Paenibacillus sp. UNC496MF]SFJ70144.1 Protein of unknown function [Paenibacillus sp. UNC496MF]
MKTIRIGAGQGFYGDSAAPAVETAKRGGIHYLCMDSLAELTLAILQKDRQRDPAKGFAADLGAQLRALLPVARANGIRIITNAGGMNPAGALREAERVAKELGLKGLKLAVVTGDDVLEELDAYREQGALLEHLEDGRDIADVRDRIVFANAYLGAKPIAEALRQGADVVITGRAADSALFLAPYVHEFGVGPKDWNRLAQGVLMGHLLECSGQASGGNFSGDWQAVEALEDIGFPIAEIAEDGTFVLTKPEGTGGLVSVDTVKEQLLYEIHDPFAYATPDVVLNVSEVALEDAGPNRVRVTGARGAKRPETLKVVMGYADGWLGQAIWGYSWPDAPAKARAADRIVRKQIERSGLRADEIRTDFLGLDSLHGPLAAPPAEEPNEVYVRLAVRTKSRDEAAKLGRLVPPLMLSGPPAMGAFLGMLKPRELLGMWSCLVPRELVERKVSVTVKEVRP